MTDEPWHHVSEVQKQWWLLIRRSFAIPDLVGEHHAGNAILDRLYPHARDAHSALGPTQEHLVENTHRILNAVIKCGCAGDLDAFMARDARFGDREAMVNLVETTADVFEARDVIGTIVDTVTDFVQHHPFRDPSGAYFS